MRLLFLGLALLVLMPSPSPAAERVRIYQVLPRLFGNVNETRKPNGTLAENGVGKFNDFNDAALDSLRAMGFTHLWLTGVPRQMTATDYGAIGLPADDPDLLKGLAGSPYAVKDYFDVCPDYAVDPAARLAEFRSLLGRLHARGMKAIIDLVPNHVARAYLSTGRPDLTFGAGDDPSRFFLPNNNFFYLRPNDPGGGPPLRLPTVDAAGRPVSPTCRVLGAGDGRFDGEREHGRVTGNNVRSWAPTSADWYETVKLNYGWDFTDPRRSTRLYPHGTGTSARIPVPDTWHKMDAVLAHWQALGVDGFRCDMAHLVPPEFWRWSIARARERQPGVFFLAEAYDDDPAKVPAGDGGPVRPVMVDLLEAGFDSVYDDPSYKVLKGIYDGPKWANDLDDGHGIQIQEPGRVNLFHQSLRYAENHDEVRLASKGNWGNVVGPEVGRPVTALLALLGRGPVMVYSGQEVGEPASDAEGFGGDDGRTSIFDYWSMPELAKWVNGGRFDGGRLAEPQRALRDFYGRLLRLAGEPAFRDGEFVPVNPTNINNPGFGRLGGETASGHWLYAFLRRDAASGQEFLVVVNLHPRETMRDVQVRYPLKSGPRSAWRWVERLNAGAGVANAEPEGVSLPAMAPLSVGCFERVER